jgi:hypothetical protein
MKRFLIPIALLVFFSAAGATTIVPMSVEKLTDVSSDVVVAHATKTWSQWNAQHTMISTYTQFSVDSHLKGTSGSTLTVKQPGGSAEGYTQHVAGVRPWTAGESAVLFLRPSSGNDGTFVVSGLMQGNFRVRRAASGAAIADNGVEAPTKHIADDVQSFDPESQSLTPYSGNRMNLDELERRVRTKIQTR